MKRTRNNGKKWIVIGIAVCLVFVAGIGIGTYVGKRNAQETGKTDQTDQTDAAQGNGSTSKNQSVQKDDGGDKSNSGGQDNASDNSDTDSEQGQSSGKQDEGQENGAGTQADGSTYDASAPEDDTAVHTYEYILSDSTWQEAFQDCLDRGGYLVRINSAKEYEHIRKEISKRKLTDVHFKLGGRRDSQSKDYYWVNEDNRLFGEKLNTDESWCSEEWMGGEPSFQDGSLEEMYMDLFFSDGEKRFVWNDVPDNMLEAEPAYAGKLGYICEYEN